jgi:hypothetical protein
MAEKRSENLDPFSNDEARRLVVQHDSEPVVACGVVPAGHEGAYVPTPEEFLEGARQVAKAQLSMATLRHDLIEERLKSVRLGKAGKETE